MLLDEERSAHTLVIVGANHALAEALSEPGSLGLKSTLRVKTECASHIDKIRKIQLSGTCVILVEIDRGFLAETPITKLSDQVRELRFAKPDVNLAFLAFGEGLSDSDLVGLLSQADMDVALQVSSPSVLAATAFALARLAEMLSKGRRQSFERDGRATLKIGLWSIDADTKIARKADGEEAKLTQGELDYLVFLRSSNASDGTSTFADGPVTHRGLRQSALVYKLKHKLGRDLPIVNTGPETYRLA